MTMIRRIVLSLLLVVSTTTTRISSWWCCCWNNNDTSSGTNRSSIGGSMLLVSAQTTTTLDKPFQSLYNLQHEACVTLYHRNGRIGCGTTSAEAPQIGRLVRFDSTYGISNDAMKTTTSSSDKEPSFVVVVMDDLEFTTSNIQLIQHTIANANTNNNNNNDNDENVFQLAGILVTNSTTTSSSNNNNEQQQLMSPGSTTPNGYGTPSQNLNPFSSENYQWNTLGTNLEYQNYYGLPIVYVADINVSSYLQDISNEQSKVSETQSEQHGSVVAEFDYYMGGAGSTGSSSSGAENNAEEDDNNNALTSKECLLWKNKVDGTWSPKCAPLGGQSVWATVGPLKQQSIQQNNGEGEEEADNNQEEEESESSNNQKPVLLIGTSIDGSSMFHEMSPSSNSAASNIFVTLLVAKLLGLYVTNDHISNTLQKQIVLGFFEGDSYGFLGSRRFFNDVLSENFKCSYPVEYSSSDKQQGKTFEPLTNSCLYPMRPSLAYEELSNGGMYGMISLDQLGVLSEANTMYVHGGQNNNQNDQAATISSFLQNVMLQCTTDDYTVAQSSAQQNGDNGNVLPPTPLTSLLALSNNNQNNNNDNKNNNGAGVGGVVLAGYDDAFMKDGLYRSHLDSLKERRRLQQDISLDALMNSAIVVARAAIAIAYDDGTAEEGDENALAEAIEFATELLPSDVLSQDDSTVQTLYECLFRNGNCEYLETYAKVDHTNDVQRVGGMYDLGLGDMMGNPPSYYVSIYYPYLSQPSVQIGGHWYGAYDPTYQNANNDNENEASTTTTSTARTFPTYGDSKYDAILLNPTGLERALHGLLNDFLGRTSDGTSVACTSDKDCTSKFANQCSSDSLEYPTCTGGLVCVCSRSHYHDALDVALEMMPNEFPTKFIILDGNDNQDQQQGEEDNAAQENNYYANGNNQYQTSPLYTEPYWSSSVGVKVYRESGNHVNRYVIASGLVVFALSIAMAFSIEQQLSKAKLH